MLGPVGLYGFLSKLFKNASPQLVKRFQYIQIPPLLAVIFFSVQAHAVTVTATVEARIIPALAATTVEGLNFGSISAGSKPGVVIVSPESTNRASTGSVSLRNAGDAHPATIRVVGTPNTSYSIKAPSVIYLRSEKGDTMSVSGITLSKGSGQIGISGEQEFKVGAHLQVGPNQEIGSYSGLMSLTLDYN